MADGDSPIKAVTNLPPKVLLLIVGGGLAAGLVWRRFAGNKTSKGFAVPATLSAGDQSMQDYYDTAFATVGNDRRYMWGNDVPQPAAPSNGTTQEPAEYGNDDTPSPWTSPFNDFLTLGNLEEMGAQYGMSGVQLNDYLVQNGYRLWMRNGETQISIEPPEQ